MSSTCRHRDSTSHAGPTCRRVSFKTRASTPVPRFVLLIVAPTKSRSVSRLALLPVGHFFRLTSCLCVLVLRLVRSTLLVTRAVGEAGASMARACCVRLRCNGAALAAPWCDLRRSCRLDLLHVVLLASSSMPCTALLPGDDLATTGIAASDPSAQFRPARVGESGGREPAVRCAATGYPGAQCAQRPRVRCLSRQWVSTRHHRRTMMGRPAHHAPAHPCPCGCRGANPWYASARSRIFDGLFTCRCRAHV